MGHFPDLEAAVELILQPGEWRWTTTSTPRPLLKYPSQGRGQDGSAGCCLLWGAVLWTPKSREETSKTNPNGWVPGAEQIPQPSRGLAAKGFQYQYTQCFISTVLLYSQVLTQFRRAVCFLSSYNIILSALSKNLKPGVTRTIQARICIWKVKYWRGIWNTFFPWRKFLERAIHWQSSVYLMTEITRTLYI